MSIAHPTISAWSRDEHRGTYQTELHDWKLTVVWLPNTPAARGRFCWEAERGEQKLVGDEPFEEMEEAMAEAERFARLDAARRTAEIAAVTAESDAG